MKVTSYDKLTLYGPHPLERDSCGNLKYHMGDVFPSLNSMIVGQDLHVTLAMDFIEEYQRKSGRAMDEDSQQEVFDDLVALVSRGEHVMVRSIPDDMDRCFRAGELLREVVPSAMIRFTGRRDPKVREAFKLRGESWKMTPRYFTVEEIIDQIRLSMVSVGTANRYYYKIESGGRLVTPQKFAEIRDVIGKQAEFRERVLEIVDLYQRRSNNYVRELDFFAKDGKRFDFSLFEELGGYLKRCRRWGAQQQEGAARLFDQALENFRAAVPSALHHDDPNNPSWRNEMYAELSEIPPTEESMLGISEEFNMNIHWLSGCRIVDGKMVEDEHIEDSASQLLDDFIRCYGKLEYINLGRLMRSQSTKRAAGSYREVFIAVLKQQDSTEEQIRILRKVYRNVLYYLNRDYELEEAKNMAAGYLEYTFDRREILSLLGANTPVVLHLSRNENLTGIGTVPVTYFNRPYIQGLATDKVSYDYYRHEGFVNAQAELLGTEAVLNIFVGRCEPDTGVVFFGDGDELLQFKGSDPRVPTSIVLADFTGTFADVISPLDVFIPQYADYLENMLGKVRVEGWGPGELSALGEVFIRALQERFYRLKDLIAEGGEIREKLDKLTGSRDPGLNPVC
ncbi:MAG: hypothetical protein FVQ81_12315, partial [Candidatus Glassbacteria bacterium]|nr:hypothetical protein [Candidatus Glassbacteria bacterium]